MMRAGPRPDRRLYAGLLLAACLATSVAAGLAKSAAAQDVRHLDEVHTPRTYGSLDAWLGRAETLRTHIRVSSGLLPMPARTPLSPRLGEPVERDGYTIQTVVLETMPGFYLTGSLYRPRESASHDGTLGDGAAERGGPGEARPESAGGPFPAVLSPHGHWDAGRFEDSEAASVPGRAINFARRGYVFFSYSMVGYNETAELLPHRFAEPHYELWGFTPMGLQLWNSVRALDFLSRLPDVDATRIGMTGASGGGTQTFLLTAIDERIKVSAPVNMISAHMQGGCVCENAPLLRLDATNIEIGALAAPRPLLMVSTSGDWTSNTPSVEFPAVRSVYGLFDAGDRIRNVHLDYPHNYNRESREAVYAWFDRWLRGVHGLAPELPFTVEDPSALQAELPADARDLAGVFESHRRRSVQQIRDARPAGWRDLYAYRDRFGTAFRHVFRAVPEPEGIELEVRQPEGRAGASGAVLIVRGENWEELEAATTLAVEEQASGKVVFMLRPHPREFAVPDSIAHWTTYNATTASRRVHEIRRALEWIGARPDVTEVDVVGLGEAGPWTLLARALVSNVRRTVIDFDGFDADEDAAYLERLFVPLLRRAGDFRTAAALIAPGQLEIRNLERGPLQTWIRDVYQAAGAADMLRME